MSGSKDDQANALEAIITEMVAPPLPEPVRAIANTAASRHGGAVKSVIFYGSSLRDDAFDDRLIDFYLIVETYKQTHRSKLEAWANRILPPNVYYIEADHGGTRLRAKYAVIALDHLERLVTPSTINPYFWARLSQPVLIDCHGPRDQARIHQIIDQAVRTFLSTQIDGIERWAAGYGQTYRTELRSEKPGRSTVILSRNQAYFAAIDQALPPGRINKTRNGPLWWHIRRVQGKTLSVLRLIKAAFTFQGGLDYLIWKIERHSGVKVELSQFERDHPILMAPKIVWRLKKQGAIR